MCAKSFTDFCIFAKFPQNKRGVCRLKHIPPEIDCLQFNDTIVFAVDIVSVIDKSIGNGHLALLTKSVYVEIRILM